MRGNGVRLLNANAVSIDEAERGYLSVLICLYIRVCEGSMANFARTVANGVS